MTGRRVKTDIPVAEHRGGVPWNRARIPFPFHFCRAQSWYAWEDHREERCACGALRNESFRNWLFKNSRSATPEETR